MPWNENISVKFILVALGVMAMVQFSGCVRSAANIADKYPKPVPSIDSTVSKCSQLTRIQDALQKLSSSHKPEETLSRTTLLQFSQTSRDCRNEVITQLIRLMDEPKIDFETDQDSYHLWKEGALLLGQLKADEGIDLL